MDMRADSRGDKLETLRGESDPEPRSSLPAGTCDESDRQVSRYRGRLELDLKTLIALLAVLAFASSSAAQPPAAELFASPGRIDFDLLEAVRTAAARGEPRLLRVEVPTGTVAVAAADTGPTSRGYWLSADTLTLVVNGPYVAGVVRAPGGPYRFSGRSGAVSPRRVVQLLGEPVVARRTVPTSTASNEGGPVGDEDGSRIDLLYVYTPAQLAEVGGELGVLMAELDLVVAEANRAYADSGIVQRLHLVAAEPVDYVQAGDTSIDLKRLRDPSDGYLDDVHRLRDQHDADIVALSNTSGFSRAYQLQPDSPGADAFAFTVVGLGGFVMAHEVGHIHGVHHDRQELQNNREYLLGLEHPYAFGYVSPAAFEPGALRESQWGTIMANSAPGDRLLRFSNPDHSYRGVPLGVPGAEPSASTDGPADARRMHNTMARWVANFRTAPCLGSPLSEGELAVRLQVANGQYVTADDSGGGGVRADQMQAGAAGRFVLVDHDGDCVESGDVVSLRTPAGRYLRAVDGGGFTLDATDSEATPWARFILRRREFGSVRNGDSVTLQAPSGHYIQAVDGGGSLVRADYDGPRPGSFARFRLSRWAADEWTFGPDRVVWRVYVSSPVRPGIPFTLTADVGNLGSVPKLESLAAWFYRSLDPEVSPDDAPVGHIRRSSLSRTGGVVSIDIELEAPTIPGTYYYGACVDRYRDSNPDNNCASTRLVVRMVTAPAPFTDHPIIRGVTPIKAVHFTELRTRIDALRAGAGLGRFAWTDPVLVAGATPVRVVHLLELRSAIGAAYAAGGWREPRWTGASVGTPVRSAHVMELRTAVVALE